MYLLHRPGSKTSGDPSGLTWNYHGIIFIFCMGQTAVKLSSAEAADRAQWAPLIYHGITLLYNFTTALLYMVLSVAAARIVARNV